MKTFSHTFVAVGALAAFAIGSAFGATPPRSAPDAANPAAERMDLTRGVQVASIYVEERSLRHYAGQTLWNTEGAELGSIRDFIVHPASNRIRYAVVSSGGVLGRIGNTLRLAPLEAIRRDSKSDRLAVDILHARWLQIPPVRDEDYVVDRFNLNATQHQELVQRFGAGDASGSQPRVTSRPASNDATQFEGLVRASEIRGKTVRTPEFTVGNIENIILDLNQGVAAALVDTSHGLMGTTAKYLVPLDRLAMGNTRQDPFTTTLTRADFDRAPPSDFGLSTRGSVKIERDNNPPAPTGRANAAVQSGGAMTVAARSVREALDNSTLARENVQVAEENGKIVLRGSVRSQQIKSDVEAAARRAARSGEVENRITIER